MNNILIIKQTSLGDVLHASGMLRAIKTQHPQSIITLFTATKSADIYKYSPWVDHIIVIDRDKIKKAGWLKFPWLIGYIYRLCKQLRKQEYELAFDLQGLMKTLLFLHIVKAKRKYAKSHWPFFSGYRNKQLHATDEMKRLLEKAQIVVPDKSMSLSVGNSEKEKIDQWINLINPDNRPILLMSPFSRSPSKDWPLQKYIEVAKIMDEKFVIVFSAVQEKRQDIKTVLNHNNQFNWYNWAGQLSIIELAALTQRAFILLCGDSFPMHLAGSQNTPVVALFGPTDENKIGPLNKNDQVIRYSDCIECNKKRHCPRNCIQLISVQQAIDAIKTISP